MSNRCNQHAFSSVCGAPDFVDPLKDDVGNVLPVMRPEVKNQCWGLVLNQYSNRWRRCERVAGKAPLCTCRAHRKLEKKAQEMRQKEGG